MACTRLRQCEFKLHLYSNLNSMEANFDNLRRLLEGLKVIGFFERIFAWNRVKLLMIDANGDMQKLMTKIEEFIKLENLFNLEKSNGRNLTDTVNRLHTETQVLKESNKQIDVLQKELTTLTEANKNFLPARNNTQ